MTTQPQIFEYNEKGGDDDWLTPTTTEAPVEGGKIEGDVPAAEETPTEKLDISKLDELRKALNPEAPKAEEKAEGEKPAADAGELDDAFIEKVSQALEKRLGLSIDEILSVLGGADAIVQQTAVEKQEQELRQFWGDDSYEANMEAVAERFAKLPPELQEKYDNVEGAKLLWALVQQERGVKETRKAKPQRETVRFIQGGKQATGQGAAANTFKLSEILEMSHADYQKNLPLIEAAFREQRVINDTV